MNTATALSSENECSPSNSDHELESDSGDLVFVDIDSSLISLKKLLHAKDEQPINEWQSDVESVLVTIKQDLLKHDKLLQFWIEHILTFADCEVVEKAVEYHNSLCEILSKLSSVSSGSTVFKSKVFEPIAWIFGLLFTVIPLDEIDFYKLDYIKTGINVILDVNSDEGAVIASLFLFSSSLSYDRDSSSSCAFEVTRTLLNRFGKLAHVFLKKVQFECFSPECNTCQDHRIALHSLLRIFYHFYEYEFNASLPDCFKGDDIIKTLHIVMACLCLSNVNILITSLKVLYNISVIAESYHFDKTMEETYHAMQFEQPLVKLLSHPDTKVREEACKVILFNEEIDNPVLFSESYIAHVFWGLYSNTEDLKLGLKFIQRMSNNDNPLMPQAQVLPYLQHGIEHSYASVVMLCLDILDNLFFVFDFTVAFTADSVSCMLISSIHNLEQHQEFDEYSQLRFVVFTLSGTLCNKLNEQLQDCREEIKERLLGHVEALRKAAQGHLKVLDDARVQDFLRMCSDVLKEHSKPESANFM